MEPRERDKAKELKESVPERIGHLKDEKAGGRSENDTSRVVRWYQATHSKYPCSNTTASLFSETTMPSARRKG